MTISDTGIYDYSTYVICALFVICSVILKKNKLRSTQLLSTELDQTKKELHKEIVSRLEIEARIEAEITERKKAVQELILLNQELESRVEIRTEELNEKNKLLLFQSRHAALGEMIGNIAHQWRQPLNTLGLTIQQIALYYELGEFNKDYLDKSVKKSMDLIQHMSQTIDDFRNYFKPDKEKTNFKVHAALENTLSLIEDSFRSKQIQIEIILLGDPVIYGYRNEFSQALLNILNNAGDALIEKNITPSKISITLCYEDGTAIITIADNAGGVPDEIISKIFDPYFTTKGPQQGTGVGLFMAKTIIEKNMGGKLSVRNNIDGAEFKIEVKNDIFDV
jgi:signal transduction histidine kinase